MKMFYYEFADGYYCYCTGFSSTEMKYAELNHGKLVKKSAVK